MDIKIITSFPVTENQAKILRKFCIDVIDSNYVIAIRVIFSEDMVLSLTMFANRPEVYFGIYSTLDKTIVSNVEINDELLLKELLAVLAEKYAHATSRKPPVVNKELAFAWMNYFNNCVSGNAKSYVIED